MEIYYGKPTAGLGELSPALVGKLSNWYEMMKDIRTMIDVFSKIIAYLREHPDLNVTNKENNDIRRAKHLVKKDK